MSTQTKLLEAQKELLEIQRKLEPLASRAHALRSQIDRLESDLFVEVNKITLEDVHLSSEADGQYFPTVYQFSDWLKTNRSKPWSEWNRRIYRTDDIIARRMPETPATMDSLKK